jgi:Thaumarchaeal output domain 1
MPQTKLGVIYKPESVKMLNHIRDNHIKRFEPSFQPVTGFLYKDIEYQSLGEQIKFLQQLEEAGIVIPESHNSVLKCDFCSCCTFCVRYRCNACESYNIIEGTAIQHDICGNIDFDYNYRAAGGLLRCQNCEKTLKAIGVDYSKIGQFFKCLNCTEMLSTARQQYICLNCGRPATYEDLRILQLFTYSINYPKLSDALDKVNYLLPVVEELDRHGIRSSFQGSITGISNTQHQFSLVVCDDKNKPLLLLEEMPEAHNNTNHNTFIFSFVGRCLDIQCPRKFLLIFDVIEEGLQRFIQSNGIIVLQSTTRQEAALEIIQKITEMLISE